MMHSRKPQPNPRAHPSWQNRCRSLLQPRALAIAAPLFLTALFGGIYSAQQAHYLNTQAATAHKSPALDSGSHASSSPSNGPTGSAGSSDNPSAQAATSQSTTNQIAGNAKASPPPLTATCDTAAKAVAATTRSTALTAENARHHATLLLLGVDGAVTNLLLPADTRVKLDVETQLHDTNINQIQNAYNTSVMATHC